MVEISEFLKKRSQEGLLRKLKAVSFRRKGKIGIDGEEFIDLSSNDYLGLAGHPDLIEAAEDAMVRFGTSSSASRLLTGDLDIHHELEEETARFKNKESALIFNSGYQLNVGIFSSLCAREDVIFSDKLNHASIVDGITLSRAKCFRFLHNDPEHLETLLKDNRPKFKKALIVTETIFSMDGDRAPLKELVRLKNKYDCQIMVDEAHATGIFGKNGSGVVEEEGLTDEMDFIMGTFSKALGSFGAYLATSREVTEYLINTCRSFVYSTSLPPAIVASSLASLELVKNEPHRRKGLLSRSQYFRVMLKKNGLEVRGSSHLVPLIVGDNKKAQEMAHLLQDRGYWVLPIRPPTVSIGEARLRFSLSYNHSMEMLKDLTSDIANVKVQILQ